MTLMIGIFGMVCIAVAFILDEFSKKFSQDTIKYNVLNMFGSALLAYYAYSLTAWPFLVLNVIWFAAATVKFARLMGKKR